MQDPDPHPSSIAACTIIARNYLAQARALIDSFLRYSPGAMFYLLVVDKPPPGIDLGPSVCLLGPDDFAIPSFNEMSFKYDVTELCTAVKPSFLRFIFSREPAVVFFDPDIVIFRNLHELWGALETSNIVLIPHLLDPIPMDGLIPNEQAILAAGAYNLGFIALKASTEVERLLVWWEERLQDHCRIDIPNALFVDQKWIDLVPSLFSGTSILRDETYDVAYWNLHSRPLERDGEQVCIHGRPLAFFHFSGYNPYNRRVLSKHQNRIAVVEGGALAYLLDLYADLVHKRGIQLAQQWPYGYDRFDNGVQISPLWRHLYQALDAADRERFGDPFKAGGTTSFFGWAVMPSPSVRALSPFLERLLVERPDLRASFSDPWGRDREAFLNWAKADGAAEMGYDPALADMSVWGPSSMQAHVSSVGGAESKALSGVNVFGYLRNETGIGAVARGFVRALRTTGVPLGTTDLAELSPNRSEDSSLDNIDGRAPYDINLLCVNADQHFAVKSHLGDELFRDRYNIGVWFWELPTFPCEWWDRFEEYDEIWATSSFIADALAPISPVPIVRVPPVLWLTGAASREAGRKRLGVEPDEFVFLFTFDFASYFERKNPLAVMQAFKGAFQSDEKARLVIKCVNEHLDQANFERMTAEAAGHAVSLYTGYWASGEMREVTAACDAFVSLHRSEGLGLTIAEAMVLGKPVIATGWSGNMDFMNSTNSFPVGYELVRLEQAVGPYPAGSVWAEPSIAEASQCMRLVYADQDQARALGEAGQRGIERDYSEARVAEVVQQRVGLIINRRRKWRASAVTRDDKEKSRKNAEERATQQHAGVQVPPTALASQEARSALGPAAAVLPGVPPMRLDESVHGPLGVLAKRSVDLLLRYHTHYQGEINVAFARFVRELDARHGEQTAELRNELSELRKGLAEVNTDLRELYRRTTWLDPGRADAVTAGTEQLRAQADWIAATARHLEEIGAVEERVDALGRGVHEHQSVSEAWRAEVEQHLAAFKDELSRHKQAAAEPSPELTQVAAAVARVEATLGARPYMARDWFGAQGDLHAPMGFIVDAQEGALGRRPSAPEFEDLFRGSEEFVAERQRVYLPFFDGMQDVVDLGSGRGEFLQLLHERGIEAIGVELNEALVDRCRARGRHVELGDALEYLERQADQSLDAVFSAQFIEHIEPARLDDLLRLACAKLRPRGLFIAETVNPESLKALKTFHVDLSHKLPIYPQVLLHLSQKAGFLSARTFYPMGGGFTQTAYTEAGEYAIVAVR